MTLRILQAKQERAAHLERLAKLVSLRQPEGAEPTEAEWVSAARAIGCPPENLFAVKAVESGGAAFNAEGRLVIAYEPHVFSRNTNPKHRYDADYPKLSYRRFTDVRRVSPSTWHPLKLRQEDRWDLLIQAADLDFDAATSAASYGMWQILGENARDLGYSDPMHMIEIMYQGHHGQLEVFIRFCRRRNCLDALIRGDWDRFERIYNGGGHNGAYAAKLRRAQADARRALA
jgi:hypothetical protein